MIRCVIAPNVHPRYRCPPCSEAAIRAKIEERRRLEREKKKFAVRLEGSLAVERPPRVSQLL